MPRWLRQFTFNKINEFYKKEAEEYLKSIGFFKQKHYWVNSKGDDGGWIRLQEINVVGKDNEEIKNYIDLLMKREQ